jgi:hypothetical protein
LSEWDFVRMKFCEAIWHFHADQRWTLECEWIRNFGRREFKIRSLFNGLQIVRFPRQYLHEKSEFSWKSQICRDAVESLSSYSI